MAYLQLVDIRLIGFAPKYMLQPSIPHAKERRLSCPFDYSNVRYMTRGAGKMCDGHIEQSCAWPTCDLHYDLVNNFSGFIAGPGKVCTGLTVLFTSGSEDFWTALKRMIKWRISSDPPWRISLRHIPSTTEWLFTGMGFGTAREPLTKICLLER